MRRNLLSLFALIITAFVTTNVQAQTADGGLNVQNLFESSAWVPGLNLPFRTTGRVLSVQVELDPALPAADCRVMRDPFIPEIFLLKCLSEARVWLNFQWINAANEVRTVHYGPIAVAGPGRLTRVTVRPDSELDIGKKLFTTSLSNGGWGCVSCHYAGGSARVLKGPTITSAQLKNAFATNPAMSFANAIPDADVAKIVAYLRSL